MSPTGVEAGGSTDLTLRGTDLEGVTTLWFDHPGLRAFHLKGATFRVACASGVPLGYHDLRAVGTYGLSNPRTLVVGDRPGISESEPNNTSSQSNPISIGTVVHGEMGAADVDFFVFEAKKGERIRIDLEAERIDSRLDATLHLLDSSGREIAESRDAIGFDPSLDVTIPTDGRFHVKIHDVLYRGSSDYPYRLAISRGPWIFAIRPCITRPGETTTATLYGTNLGGEVVPGLLVDEKSVERKVVTINAPDRFEPDPDYPTASYVGSVTAARHGFEYVYSTPDGRSNPYFIAFATDPVVPENEPNDGDQVQEVAVPLAIAGSFERPGDMDVFRFTAKKGQVLWIESVAERLGSPADPVFVIQKVGEKGALSDLATGDDLPDKGAQARFATATVDAATRWMVPEDGVFQVAISDLYASQRGDIRLTYQLNIRPERPDFQLFVVPDSPSGPDAVTINAGGRSLAQVFATRFDGYNGPIRVEAVDLPEGIRCEPVVIPPDQSIAPIVFEAAEGAKEVLGRVRLVGRGRHGDRKEELDYVSGASRLGPDLQKPALAGGMVWPGDKPNSAPARLSRGFVLKVIGPAPLTLNAGPAVLKATPGSLVTLDLSAKRREGFAEAVAVSLVNPLPGTPNPPPTGTIAKGAEAGLFHYILPKTLTPGVYSLVLQGSGPFPFSKDPNAKTKPNVTIAETSNPLNLVVLPRPAKVSVTSKSAALKAGESLEFEATITPNESTAGPIALELDSPASLKLKSEPVTVTPGKPMKLTIRAASDSPPGAVVGVSFRISVPWRGNVVEIREPLTLTINK